MTMLGLGTPRGPQRSTLQEGESPGASLISRNESLNSLVSCVVGCL